MSDCTPPTGVRWAAQDGCSKVGVKSPVFLFQPTFFFFLKDRLSSKAVAANEWAGDGDLLWRWGESWPSKGHV